MTPAEELTAAADKLNALIAESDDQIRCFGIGNPYWGANYSEIVRDALGGAIGEHAAAMNPLVGKALAEWLRDMVSDTYLGSISRGRALAIARLINGGGS